MKKFLNSVITAIISGVFALLAILLRWILVNYKKRDKLSLSNHSFFTQMRIFRKIRIPQLQIDNPKKERLIKSFLEYKFQVFERIVKDLVDHCMKTNLDNEEFYKVFVNYILNGIGDYEHKALELEPTGIFLKRFKEWHYESVNNVLDNAQDIINSNFLRTKEQKLVSILNLLLSSFDMTIIHAEKTINSLNGELEKALEHA